MPINQKRLSAHIRKVHIPIQVNELLVCPHCGKTVRQLSLSKHINMLHTADIKHCTMCSYTTRNKHTMTKHFKLIHTESMLKPCIICGKVVKDVTSHVSNSSCGQREKTEQCIPCDIKFYRRNQLDRHVRRIHDKVKDKPCPKCPYTTYSSHNLRLHITNIHDKTTMFQMCPHCEKKTGNLERHISTYHCEQTDIIAQYTV